ncbi:MAG: hypothetical protein ABFD82_23545 [Syntrophaceae bacterium]
MKTHDCIITLNNQLFDAECHIIDADRVKWLGHHEVTFDVEVLTIATLPVSCFTPETIEEVASQLRHDVWLQAEAERMTEIDDFGNYMDMMHDRRKEAI